MLIYETSHTCRTNQLQIDKSPQAIEQLANGLYHWAASAGYALYNFIAPPLPKDPKLQARHIRSQVEQRVRASAHPHADPVYRHLVVGADRQAWVYFLLKHTRKEPPPDAWIPEFISDMKVRSRIFQLFFQLHLFLFGLDSEYHHYGDAPDLLIGVQRSESRSKSVFIEGYTPGIFMNHHGVLSLSLKRNRLVLHPDDTWASQVHEKAGTLLHYNSTTQGKTIRLDARKAHRLNFADFSLSDGIPAGIEDSQIYLQQVCMDYLEQFISECGVDCTPLPFTANCMTEKNFVTHSNFIDLPHIEIMNNLGRDLTGNQQRLLSLYLNQMGIERVSFYADGRTLSRYQFDDNTLQSISEAEPWSAITLSPEKNYLVLNRILDADAENSRAWLKDGVWISENPDPKKMAGMQQADLYFRLKQKLYEEARKKFYSLQGVDLPDFRILPDKVSTTSLFARIRSSKKNGSSASSETQKATLLNCRDMQQLQQKMERYRLKSHPAFERIVREIAIKSWMRKSLQYSSHTEDHPYLDMETPLQTASPVEFSVIYVRNPRHQQPRIAAAHFRAEGAYIFLESIEPQIADWPSRYPFLKTSKSGHLFDDQLVYYTPHDGVYLTSYTSDNFTPHLLGIPDMPKILAETPQRFSRNKAAQLLPCITYYNDTRTTMKHLVCLDTTKEGFVQMFVPPDKLRQTESRGFPVYHILAKHRESTDGLTTDDLVAHPLFHLHISTLTTDILQISQNSKTSLLEKVAKVLVEN